MSAFLAAFQAKVRAHEIVEEPEQSDAIAALDGLCTALASARSPGKGVYLWGHVGRGKSMLMNLFYEQIPGSQKQRLHFHAFMRDIHSRLQRLQMGETAVRDPLKTVATDYGAEVRVLCLDELEIVDIADAMIVGRLFDGLFMAGVAIVVTSNDPPDQLYKDGPNRSTFEPFIDRLKAHMEIVELGGDHDRRADGFLGKRRYLSPISSETAAAFDRQWRAGVGNELEEGAQVEAHGHAIGYRRTAGARARVQFADMCDRALGPDDHLGFAERFREVFLEGVPRLRADHKDEARRFVTLIDALYDAHVRLVVLAEATADEIFEDSRPEDHQRTSSRLKEMTSDQWWHAPSIRGSPGNPSDLFPRQKEHASP